MAISTIDSKGLASGAVGSTQLASGAALANIGTGGVTPTYLASGAAVSNIGYTPVNAANLTYTNINSNPIGNIDFNTSGFATVNATYYKWDLAAAGNYLIFMTVRARLWGVNGFGKVRLLNATTGVAVPLSDTMLIESSNSSLQLNMMCSAHWPYTATVPTTLYLQGNATAANIGIQSDSNGYNNCTWLRIS
jgi:hypothetical protein